MEETDDERRGEALLCRSHSLSLEKMTLPALIIHGDQDRSCLGTGAFLMRTIPSAERMVSPKTGHANNRNTGSLAGHARGTARIASPPIRA